MSRRVSAMRGITHALAGVTTLAAITLATGEPMSAWAFALAGASALIPDADNGPGSILNRAHLLPIKIMTFPLWYGSRHRGRTHSFAGAALFAGIIAFWVWLAGLGATWTHTPNPFPNLDLVLVSVLAGYLSHLLLDFINKKDEKLFWPVPVGLRFPVGVTADGTADWLLHGGLVLFLGWFVVSQAGPLITASSTDPTLSRLPEWTIKVVVALVGAGGHFISQILSNTSAGR